jgi:gliding motility-associated-like protein
MRTKLFIECLLFLVLTSPDYILKSQGLYSLCGSKKGVNYQTTGKPGSLFHWTVEGGQIVSNPQASSITVDWNNDQGDFAITVFEETKSGCYGNTMRATVRITPSPIIDLGKQKTICEGGQVQLTADIDYSKYLWQDGSTNSYFIAKAAGVYWLEVTNQNGCSYRDSVTVIVSALPKVDLGPDKILCAPDELLLDAGGGETFYNWSNGATAQTTLAHEGDGQIWVHVTDANGCVGSDTIQILKCSKEEKLEIANAFTPNGDGHNDYWEIKGYENYPNMTIKLYDRWGIEVFNAEHGYSHPWNGTSNGKVMPTGAYYYIIILGDGSKEIKGSVTLIR